MPMTIEAISSKICALVHGRAGDMLQHGGPAQLIEALDRHGVLVFSQFHMSDDTVVQLTAALGDMHDNVVTYDGSAAS